MWWALRLLLHMLSCYLSLPYRPERTGGAGGDGWWFVCWLWSTPYTYKYVMEARPVFEKANSPTTEPLGSLLLPVACKVCLSIHPIAYILSISMSRGLCRLSCWLALIVDNCIPTHPYNLPYVPSSSIPPHCRAIDLISGNTCLLVQMYIDVISTWRLEGYF